MPPPKKNKRRYPQETAFWGNEVYIQEVQKCIEWDSVQTRLIKLTRNLPLMLPYRPSMCILDLEGPSYVSPKEDALRKNVKHSFKCV